MFRPARSLRLPGAAAAAVTLACLAVAAAPASDTPAPEAEATKVSPDTLRQAATDALRGGQPERAYMFSDALVARDGGDSTALLIRSRAARNLGRYDVAQSSARLAWDQAETGEDKYASSMVMAQALASAGSRTRAQLWLRRAAHHAPNEALENRAIRDFRYVRLRNPWRTHISFSITPDSNINNGTSEKYQPFEMGGIPFTNAFATNAQPIPGLEVALGVSTRYRFHETETRAHDLTFAARAQHYILSSETKARVPGVEGNDYDFAYYEFGYAHKGKNRDGRGEYRVSTAIGQTWYGGEEYSRYFNVGGGQSFYLTKGRSVGIELSARRTFGVTRSDLNELKASATYRFPVRTMGVLSTSLDTAYGISPNDPTDDYTSVGLRARYSLAKPIIGARAHFSVSARRRLQDNHPIVVGGTRLGREDDRFSADVTLIFDKIDYYGFSPSVRLSTSRTNSNYSRAQSERAGINFGIQSTF